MKIYRFLTGDDDATFCHKVTEALNNGWKLYGAPQYAFDETKNAMRCGQAVVKKVAKKDYHPSMKLSEQ